MRRLHWVGIVAVAMLAAGGIAYAAIPDSVGVIHSCYSRAVGTWRPIDTEANPPQTCKSGETPLDWNQTGPPGPPGQQGEPGQPGKPGEQGPPGVVDAYYKQSSSPVFLQVGSYQTILTLSLPAGTWSLSGTVNLNNFSGGRVPVLCAFFAQFGSNFSRLSIAGLASFPGPGGDALTMPLSAIIELGQPGVVEMQCQSNSGTTATALAEGRQMTALSVSNLTVQP